MNRKVLLQWMTALAALLFLAWIFQLYNRRQPVQYPADWPFEYVQVPQSAIEGELYFSPDPRNRETVIVRPWEVADGMQPDNRKRSLLVGFNYGGSYEEAKAELEEMLSGKGWRRHGGISVTSYWADDNMYSIKLSHMPAQWIGFNMQPEFWELAIYQYSEPVDYYPAAQEAEPLDQ